MDILNAQNFNDILDQYFIPCDVDANTTDIINETLRTNSLFKYDVRVQGISPETNNGLVLGHIEHNEQHKTIFVAVKNDLDELSIRTIVKRPNEECRDSDYSRPVTISLENNPTAILVSGTAFMKLYIALA